MRSFLLLAAGLCLASAAVQAQASALPPAKPDVHAHVATSLLYHESAAPGLSPLVTRPALPALCELAPCPATVRYLPARRTARPHVEYIERTYVVVEDSVPKPPPRGRQKL